MFLPHPRVKVGIVGSLRDREVACSALDRQGSNFESCVWRTVSSQSSHHPQEVLLAQFSLYVLKGGLKPDSFPFYFVKFLYPSCLKDGCEPPWIRRWITIDLVIFAGFQFSRISRGGQFREFENRSKIIIKIAILKKNENSKLRGKSQNKKIRENLNTQKLPDLQYCVFLLLILQCADNHDYYCHDIKS